MVEFWEESCTHWGQDDWSWISARLLPDSDGMEISQPQSFHSDNHITQSTRQRIREGDLRSHLLAHIRLSDRLNETFRIFTNPFCFNMEQYIQQKQYCGETNCTVVKSSWGFWKSHLNVEIRRSEPKAGLIGQNLLGLTDPSRQSQHERGLIHQLVLILRVWQHPFNDLL